MKLSLLLFTVLLLTSCSHSQIMKECKQVADEEMYVCKTMKPWE
jgi:hypothetical protein